MLNSSAEDDIRESLYPRAWQRGFRNGDFHVFEIKFDYLRRAGGGAGDQKRLIPCLIYPGTRRRFKSAAELRSASNDRNQS